MEKSVTKPFFSFSGIAGAVKRFCFDKKIYFIVFFLPTILMFAVYAFFKVTPFGDNSVLVLDLNGQYVYYYEAFRDAFWGDGSFIYDWSRNLSGEMFGIFAYYLASPFMLIICMLPRTWMVTSIMIMQLAKMGTAAVTFAFFLNKISPKKPKLVSMIAFPTAYAFMAYMVVQFMDPMWLDGLIYLPLICWGVHRLINESRLIPYIVPLALMFIAHFYIGYMVGIFTFFYFCYVCFSQEGRIVPKKFFSKCILFGVGTLISLMCAAFVLIPVYNSLKLGKFEFTEPDFSLATQFDFLTFITKMFPMTYDTVYPEGMPMVYCGAASLIFVPLFFMNNKISMKEKVSKGLLAVILVVLMYIKPVDMVMHGFQVPNWLPYRYSFIFSFIIILMAFRAFENLDGITAKNIGGVFFGLMVFLFWCERENYGHFQLFETRTASDGITPHNVIQGIWFSMIALSVYFVLIYLIRKYPKSKAAALCLTVAFSIEFFANSADTLEKIDKDVAYSKATSYEPYMSNLRNAVDTIYDFDKSPFYRMEATFHRTVNDPIGTGYYGISHSSSTMNAPALTALHRLGYAYGGHYTKYDGATFMTDALFDIKYLMDKTGDTSYVGSRVKVPEEYSLTTETTQGTSTFKFYNNPNALGLGIASSPEITTVHLGESNPFENQNAVFRALTGKNTQYFTRLDVINTEQENVTSMLLDDGHTKYYPTDPNYAECHVDYVVEMDKDSYLYMYLPTKYERSCNIWIQNEEDYVDGENQMDYAGQFFVGDNYSILNLGKFIQGQQIRVRITIANDENEAFWSDQQFCTFNYDEFSKDCAELKQKTWNITEFSDTFLEGTVNALSNEEVLFTTIPYENGWTIKVNGKTVEPIKSLDSLITIPLEAGENTVTMEFSPDYWKFSIIISVFGLILVILVFLFEYKKGRYMKNIMHKALIKHAPDNSEGTNISIMKKTSDNSEIDTVKKNDYFSGTFDSGNDFSKDKINIDKFIEALNDDIKNKKSNMSENNTEKNNGILNKSDNSDSNGKV